MRLGFAHCFDEVRLENLERKACNLSATPRDRALIGWAVGVGLPLIFSDGASDGDRRDLPSQSLFFSLHDARNSQMQCPF